MKITTQHKNEVLSLLGDIEEQIAECVGMLSEPHTTLSRQSKVHIATVMMMSLVLLADFNTQLYFLRPDNPLVVEDGGLDLEDIPF